MLTSAMYKLLKLTYSFKSKENIEERVKNSPLANIRLWENDINLEYSIVIYF